MRAVTNKSDDLIIFRRIMGGSEPKFQASGVV